MSDSDAGAEKEAVELSGASTMAEELEQDGCAVERAVGAFARAARQTHYCQ